MEKCAAFRLRNAGQKTVPLYLGEVAQMASEDMETAEPKAWSTPSAHDGRRPGPDLYSTQGRNLSREASLWKTPRVERGGYTRDRGDPAKERLTLEGEAALWPTSRTVSGGAESGERKKELGREDSGGGDAKGSDTLGRRPETDDRLATSATRWRTPNLTDADGGTRQEGQEGQEGQVQLCHQTSQWCTPSVAMTEGGQTSRSGDRKDELLLPSQAKALSMHQDLEKSTGGEPSSRVGRSLNPLFVEILMNWPPGFTLLLSTGSTDYASSVMVLTHYRARMRSELLRIGLPPGPPPAKAPRRPEPEQFGLFL